MAEKGSPYEREQELRMLSEDLYSVEELEARLELASGIIDTLAGANPCTANYCSTNACNNNTNIGW